jgi:hypothetical protein
MPGRSKHGHHQKKYGRVRHNGKALAFACYRRQGNRTERSGAGTAPAPPPRRENDLPMQNLMAGLRPRRLICGGTEGRLPVPCEDVAMPPQSAIETGSGSSARAGANLTKA